MQQADATTAENSYRRGISSDGANEAPGVYGVPQRSGGFMAACADRIAIVVNPSNPNAAAQLRDFRAAASTLRQKIFVANASV
jgi:hypothetical protein